MTKRWLTREFAFLSISVTRSCTCCTNIHVLSTSSTLMDSLFNAVIWNKLLFVWGGLFFLLIMLLQLSHFRPFTQLHPAYPLPPTFPPYSSCPWVILISSLASTFPTRFLPSPCLFSTYHLCYLFSVPFPPSPPPNPLLIILHVISISVVLFLF